MSEFALIEQYCNGIGVAHQGTRLSVGDDAALIEVPHGMELAVSVDTMVEGVHFFSNVDAESLAHKLMAVNVSDMAAMGARPAWATLALTLPKQDEAWLSSFSEGLNAAAQMFGVELIGGDTTSGPLTLSLQIMGLVPTGSAIKRSGARPGDAVYVSGVLGDAALALRQKKHSGSVGDAILARALDRPTPQIKLGLAMRGIVSSAIDVSDGLLADLSHIAKASDVCLELEVEKIPRSAQVLAADDSLDLALNGGDDYQLAMTVPADQEQELLSIAESSDTALSKIGVVVANTGELVRLFKDSKEYPAFKKTGYDHFSDESGN